MTFEEVVRVLKAEKTKSGRYLCHCPAHDIGPRAKAKKQRKRR